jgi:hypothetical protein
MMLVLPFSLISYSFTKPGRNGSTFQAAPSNSCARSIKPEIQHLQHVRMWVVLCMVHEEGLKPLSPIHCGLVSSPVGCWDINIHANLNINTSQQQHRRKLWKELGLQITKILTDRLADDKAALLFQERTYGAVPDSQRLFKYYSMWICCLKQQQDKQIYNRHYWVTACQTNMFPWNNWTATEEQCFLCSPWQDVITRTISES